MTSETESPYRVLRLIAEGTASASGDSFFYSLVRSLSQALHVSEAFVTECTGENQVQMLAYWHNDHFRDNTAYDITGTPCEQVIKDGACFIPRDTRRLFPDEIEEGYLGVSLIDSGGNIIGHLAVMDDKPITDQDYKIDVLRIFASRAAAELERRRAEDATNTSEERYRMLFESNPLPAFVYDMETLKFLAVNRAAVRHYGYEEAEFLGKSFVDLLTEADVARFLKWFANPGMATQTWLFSCQNVTRDGTVIQVETTRRMVVFDGRMACLSLINDITERKKIELERKIAYKTLEERVQARTREIQRRREVAESLRDILAVLNSNQELEDIFNYIAFRACHLLSSDAVAIYNENHRSKNDQSQIIYGFSQNQPLPYPEVIDQVLLTKKTVSISDVVEHGVNPGFFRGVIALPLTIRDQTYGCLVVYYKHPCAFTDEELGLAITFCDQVALAIENAHLRLQAQKAAVMEERERLSRELHDSVTQSLYSLLLLAEGRRRMLQHGQQPLPEDTLSDFVEIAQQSLKEMRLLVHELRPPDLEQDGLLGALHQRLGSVEKRAGVEARLIADSLTELPPLVEEELYRITQEALNNTLKHANASKVTVRLKVDQEYIILEIIDNGCGFDPSMVKHQGGAGLNNMLERAQKIGGNMEIIAPLGQGTTIRVTGKRYPQQKRMG